MPNIVRVLSPVDETHRGSVLIAHTGDHAEAECAWVVTIENANSDKPTVLGKWDCDWTEAARRMDQILHWSHQ